MKKNFTILILAALTIGLLGSCKKDENLDQQEEKSFEEIVKELPGTYLSSTFYSMHGYGHIVSLKEDGTVKLYWFTDDDVTDGVDIDDTYEMSGTWEAFRVDKQLNDLIRSKVAIRMELTEVTTESPERVVDTTYLFTYKNRNCVYSTNFGEDEFVVIDEEYLKSTEKLEEYLRNRQESNIFYGEDMDERSDTKALPFPMTLATWMSQLPDDVLLCDLTIPGSHDALSYRCENSAQTQTGDIAMQFVNGSRFFDIRYYMRKNGVFPCHGNWYSLSKTKTIKDELIKLEQMLLNCSRECAIVMFNNNGEDDYTEEQRKNWIETYVFNNSLVPYVEYRPDLQLGDVRGKIVVMTRDWNEYPGYDSWCAGMNGPVNNPGGLPNKVFWYLQDYCDFENNNDERYSKESYFEETAEHRSLVTNQPSQDRGFNDLKWSINCMSGYYKTYQPAKFSSYIYPLIDGYVYNCNNNNKRTFGIVPLDYIGRNRVAGGITEAWVRFDVKAHDVVVNLIKSNEPLIQWYTK